MTKMKGIQGNGRMAAMYSKSRDVVTEYTFSYPTEEFNDIESMREGESPLRHQRIRLLINGFQWHGLVFC